MRFLPVAGLAASASAFLVVPDVSVDTESLPDGIRESMSQTLELDCPGCPVRMPSGEMTTELDSHLQFKFEVDLQQGRHFFLNGFQLYPSPTIMSKTLTAPHIVDMPEGRMGMMRGGMMHAGSANMMNSVDNLGFTLASGATAAQNRLQHIAMELQVVELNETFVSGIPIVHVDLVKDDAGMLAIESITVEEVETPSAVSETDANPKCDSWLCDWIASLENHWNHWRPHCMGGKNHTSHHRPGHHKGPHHGHHGHHGGDQPEEPEDPEDPEQPGESPMSYGERQRSWGKLMWSIGTHILLPVLIGIFAGVAMSLVGMVVGTFFVHVYRFFFRSSCPRRRDVPKIVVVHEEKSGLMEHQEPPPSYEENDENASENADTKV